jgi:hypothetical protein
MGVVICGSKAVRLWGEGVVLLVQCCVAATAVEVTTCHKRPNTNLCSGWRRLQAFCCCVSVFNFS